MSVPQPKKSKWLQEVEDDAVRITNKRFKEYFEELEYQKAKKLEENQIVEKTLQSGGETHESELTKKG